MDNCCNLLTRVTLTHWFPILTRCPVTGFYDPIFVEVTFVNEFVELHEFRTNLKKLLWNRVIFMEDAAKLVFEKFPDAKNVRVRLAFSKHIVEIVRLW